MWLPWTREPGSWEGGGLSKGSAGLRVQVQTGSRRVMPVQGLGTEGTSGAGRGARVGERQRGWGQTKGGAPCQAAAMLFLEQVSRAGFVLGTGRPGPGRPGVF